MTVADQTLRYRPGRKVHGRSEEETEVGLRQVGEAQGGLHKLPMME